ncbi:hypothetical protein B4O97_01700 [Marispirochaeta aestuarii]|uniref:Uncharacterized protein n=1 Tax=Marispirochaeta aestuarii TaxID=1963862 RepID=A0A1Y1S2Z6_9SPIO|nr:hypothetical protein B4O97_01700 [Marispirochaeta aestuarii]
MVTKSKNPIGFCRKYAKKPEKEVPDFLQKSDPEGWAQRIAVQFASPRSWQGFPEGKIPRMTAGSPKKRATGDSDRSFFRAGRI